MEKLSVSYAGVIVDVYAAAVDRLFHYSIPEGLSIGIGHRVLVPFGARKVEGYVIELTDSVQIPPDRIRPIAKVLDPQPLLTTESVTLAKWMADYYVGLLSQALQLFLPPGARHGRAGAVARTETWIALTDATKISHYFSCVGARAPVQRGILQLLAQKPSLPLRTIIAKFPNAYGSLQTLEKKGMIRKEKLPLKTKLQDLPAPEEASIQLTDAQIQSIQAIRDQVTGNRAPVLLHGATGSGKTEVYMRAIADMLDQGKQCIYLVPEISLTHQTMDRFYRRFGSVVAVAHSGLSPGQRFDQWMRVFREEANLVIGARSAIFAPVKRLGLVILDEEHENTFKQDDSGLRYHARTVARQRCTLNQAQLVLGSATPSLDSYHEAVNRKTMYLTTMPERIQKRPQPYIRLVDMRREFANGNRTMFSMALQQNLNRILSQGEQAIIFLNRRGFSSFVLCRECGNVVECDNCQVSLTYHEPDQCLRCHYCNLRREMLTICPSCGSKYLRQFGVGTQQVEEAVKETFPQARPVRMDTDSTSRKGAYARLFEQFRQGQANVLIGTQMVAKGLDFPNVTLVGILSADLLLSFPDFRASERAFQLITQAAGRTGRGEKPGRVLIQCYDPSNKTLQAIAAYDHQKFYQTELAFRQQVQYPPFGHFLRLLVTGPLEAVQAHCRSIHGFLRQHLPEEAIYGPFSAPIGRIKGQFRWHFLLKTPRPISVLLHQLPDPPRQVTRIVDVEPANLL